MAPAKDPKGRRRMLLASPARIPLILLGFALVYGTVGFVVIEGFSLLDAVYMTVTTLTTVGFGEIEPLSGPGRAFTITLIAVGFAAVFVLIAVLTSQLASGELGRSMARRTMRRRLEDLDNHFVLCAYGRVGRSAAAQLTRQGVDFVVIDIDTALEPALLEADVPYVLDDPAKEAVLERAGIRRARALLCAVDSDAVNVYITLSARALNPDLFIIARAAERESVDTLRRAGANRVVSPYTLSGVRMAALALQPAVLEFADMVSVAPDLRVEELAVRPGSELASQTVREACSPFEGVMVLAVRHATGQTLVPPRGDTVISADDVLIVLGPQPALEKLAVLAS